MVPEFFSDLAVVVNDRDVPATRCVAGEDILSHLPALLWEGSFIPFKMKCAFFLDIIVCERLSLFSKFIS